MNFYLNSRKGYLWEDWEKQLLLDYIVHNTDLEHLKGVAIYHKMISEGVHLLKICYFLKQYNIFLKFCCGLVLIS